MACIVTLLSTASTFAAPSYFSYFGLARNIPEAQDHVNLYWAVSWIWDRNEVLSELADARARGMRAIVNTEFAFFIGSGQYANSCPYTLRPDAAARWDSFAQALAQQGLLDTVAAFYPMDEPDLCGVSPNNVLSVLNVIRSHPLTASKPIAVIFTCDIAEKYGGRYRFFGEEHEYGEAVRAYDWVGVDCYGSENMFTEPAWRWFGDGPALYDNLKLQLNLSWQRLILVPQGFIDADVEGLPDDPQLFANKATGDPSVILLAPFTWFDQLWYPGVRSQPALATQWRNIGRSIALANPPNANPPLPPPVAPRLQVTASDIQHFYVYDQNCNASSLDVCAVQLFWHAVNTQPVQLFLRQSGGAPQLMTCSASTAYVDAPWIAVGYNFAFELYQLAGCPTTIPSGATPIATLNLALAVPSAPPSLLGMASRKIHTGAGTFDLPLASMPLDPTTEPRSAGTGGSHTIVFIFDKPVTGGTAMVMEGAAVAGVPTFSGNEMIVPLTDVTNAQYVTVAVSNVAAADGGTGGSASVRTGFLLGDVNGSRGVTLSDTLLINAFLSQTVSAANFLRDVNVSGTLTLSDLLVANANLTQALPPP